MILRALKMLDDIPILCLQEEFPFNKYDKIIIQIFPQILLLAILLYSNFCRCDFWDGTRSLNSTLNAPKFNAQFS
jgi:hypothetical protein